MRIFLTIVLILFIFLTCYSQSKSDSIYLGTVNGVSKKVFSKKFNDKYQKRTDTLLGIDGLIKSSYPIEIRFYEDPDAMAVKSCTILYFDSILKIKKTVINYNGWEEKFTPVFRRQIEENSLDSLFRNLVSQGIFSLSRPKNLAYYDTTKKALIKNNVRRLRLFVGILHPTSFTIQYKVDDVFNSIYFDGGDLGYSKYYYDDQFLKRLVELTKLLAGYPTHIQKAKTPPSKTPPQ